MYVLPNFKSKKLLKEAVAAGKIFSDSFFQPGLGPEAPQDGVVSVEGPHSPAAHSWYARVTLQGGKAVKVS